MSKKKSRIEMRETNGKRGRRGALLVGVGVAGVAVWVAHRHLTERRGPADGWHTLPPAPAYEPGARVRSSAAVEDAVTAEMLVPAPQASAAAAVPAPPVAMPPTSAARPRPAPEPAAPPSASPERFSPRTLADRATAAAAAVPVPDRPEPTGSLPALADGSSPDPDYVVKGKTATKVFHAPGGAYYLRTRADIWFRTADDARAAGFTERVRQPR